MSSNVLAVVLVLIAAVIQALSNVIQHKAVSGGDSGNWFVDLLGSLKRPLFILGISLMVVGFGFHVWSLGIGTIAVVQPVFVTQIIFILPFVAWISHVHVAGRDWANAAMVTVALALFLIVANPSQSRWSPMSSQWLIAVFATYAICLVIVGVGYGFKTTTRAVLIGIAAGLMNGLVAPLTKVAFDTGAEGMTQLFTSWLFYAAIVSATFAVLLPVMAYQAGPITKSLPLIMTINPVYAVTLSMWLFGEDINSSAGALAVISVTVVTMCVGIVALSRSEAVSGSFEDVIDIMPP